MQRDRASAFIKMTRETDEGVFVNIVDKDKCESVLEQIRLTMKIH
jgi:hypothetical protein